MACPGPSAQETWTRFHYPPFRNRKRRRRQTLIANPSTNEIAMNTELHTVRIVGYSSKEQEPKVQLGRARPSAANCMAASY